MRNVCVLFGGANSEHEVSLRSAASVLRNLSPDRYRVLMVGITKDGRWLLYTGTPEQLEDGTWEQAELTVPAVISPDRNHHGLIVLGRGGDATVLKIDVVFPVLHGKNGEDGTIQGLLEVAGIPFVGSSVCASAVCMDKAIAHELLVAAGVPKTKLIGLRSADLSEMHRVKKRLAGEIGYPMFVKPANAGSSVGVTRVNEATDLAPAMRLALEHDSCVVVEQAVIGREIECAVMGGSEPQAAKVVGEIEPTAGFYDYDAKYLNDSALLHVPARIDDPEKVAEIRNIAVKAYRALGCKGLARVDFFLKEDGTVILNEINTIPGFTSISMFPRLFMESGFTYPTLIDRLISQAVAGE